MSLEKGVNSYATVLEGDIYFDSRLSSDSWTSASSTTKSNSLITASTHIDHMGFSGTAVGTDMAFPRNGIYFDKKLGKEMPMDPVPDSVIMATFELAIHKISNPNTGTTEVALNKIVVDVIELEMAEGAKPAPAVPTAVYDLLKPFKAKNGAGLWWRAN